MKKKLIFTNLSAVESCLLPKMESLPALNTALINTLNNILEAPLDCSTMKSTTLFLPPFLAPLVPVADVLEGKDFWTDLVTINTVEELQQNLTNVNLFVDEDDLPFDGVNIKENSTMHYRIRPIEGGQFRLVNFASHFICVQIFQIDFPLILYLKGTK